MVHIAALVEGVEPDDLRLQPFNLGPLHHSCLVQVVLHLPSHTLCCSVHDIRYENSSCLRK